MERSQKRNRKNQRNSWARFKSLILYFINMKTEIKMKIRQPIVTVVGHVDHGKCVSPETLIPLSDGRMLEAEKIYEEYKINGKPKEDEEGEVIKIKKGPKIFSFDGENIVKKKITHLWKLRSPKELVQIKLASGDIIEVTPEHPFFVLTQTAEIKEKTALDINQGEFILAPRQLAFDYSDIQKVKYFIINKLKNLNEFVVFLDKSKSKKFIRKLFSINLQKLKREKILTTDPYSCRFKRRFRIRDFILIAEEFGFNYEDIYNMISGIKYSSKKQRACHTCIIIKLPKTAREFEYFGYILGCLAGDGYIREYECSLYNNDKEIQTAFSKYLKRILGLKTKFVQGRTCQVARIHSKTFYRFLIDIAGFPKSEKSKNISLPELVQQNFQLLKGFITGWFDTDGYVSKLNNSIEITSKSKEIVKQVSLALLGFGIHSAVFQKNKFNYLRIANKPYIERFLLNFNSRLKRKRDRIKNAIEKSSTSRIFDLTPLSGSFLKNVKISNELIPYFDKYKTYTNLSREFLQKVCEEGNIKILNPLLESVSCLKIILKEIVKAKSPFIYDFTVPELHNFVAERVFVHNTTILDSIRETIVAKKEAGGITQKISCTSYPIDLIKKKCSGLLEKFKIKLEIPGFLFIDTPGHAAFINLRKRGGNLADLAILVVDINEGFMPQTLECIEILKAGKVPFIVALNKIDAIHGWKKQNENLQENISLQADYIGAEFEKKFSRIVEALTLQDFNSDIFYRISDFSRQVALVPCSGKTAEGVKELLITLCGLSQKFLKGKLQVTEEARGTILEVKREKSIIYLEAVLYDGSLKQGDTIAIASFDEPLISKIRILSEAMPLCKGFKPVKEVNAAAGIRMQLAETAEILPGMPFSVVTKSNKDEVIKVLKQEIEKTIQTEKEGIIVKADSLGSLEALITLLRKEGIRIGKASIGNINKVDVMNAAANFSTQPLNAIVLGFNVSIDEDAQDARVKVLVNDVIYRLIEDFQKWLVEKQKEMQRETLANLIMPCKIKVLRFVFRQSKPAIFGVHVDAGILKAGIEMINAEDEKISEIKAIQSENKSIEKAEKGMDVAISMPNITFGRQIKENDILYSEMSEENFRSLKKNKQYLSADEISVLQEIAQIKRRKKTTWGI